MLLFAVETDWSSLVWFVCLSGLFGLSLISRLYGAGNCWHRLSGVRSKLVNQIVALLCSVRRVFRFLPVSPT